MPTTTTTLRSLLVGLIVFVPCFLKAQVKSIGISFNKRGYIELISAAKNKLKVNYIANNEIETQYLHIGTNTIIKTEKNIVLKPSDLQCGMQLQVDGEYFTKADSSIAKTITIVTATGKSVKIEEGRFDGYKDGFAYVDGSKVTLGKGVQIKGVQGYKGKSFRSFSELVLGDLIKLEAGIDARGYLVAGKVEVQPDLKTELDKRFVNNEFHDWLYSRWSDKEKRKELLGTYIKGFGYITNSMVLQDYVSKIGMSLVPQQVKEKINVLFVVVTDASWNASMEQNGLCIVHTGLLETMNNEAELAAVLGHEIAHAYYEHISDRVEGAQKVEKKKRTLGQIGGILNKVIEKATPTITVSNGSNKVLHKATVDSVTTNALFKQLPAAIGAKQVSEFSVENELQSDRVGLYLLVAAGYDPRSAPVVWREQYNRSRADRAEIIKKQKSSVVESSIAGMKSNNEPSIFSFGGSVISQVFNRNIDNIKSKSVATHPDDIRRFEALNKLIDLNYSDPALLQTLVTNSGTWVNTWNSSIKELDKDQFEFLYASTEDPKEKLGLLDYAIKKGYTPLNTLYNKRGLVNIDLQNYTAAITDFTKSISLKANSSEVYFFRGFAKELNGKSLDAIVDFTKAITLKGDEELYYSRRAKSKISLSKYTEAIADYNKMMSLNSRSVSAYIGRGYVYYKQKKYSAAITDYEKVLEFDPENETAATGIEACRESMNPATGNN